MRIILQNWDYWINLAKLIKGVDLKNLIRTNLPNSITAIGIILTARLNVILWSEPVKPLPILLLSLSIWSSDLLDGWLARRLKTVGSVGDFLDRFRDKLYFCSLFTYFFKELWCGIDGIWSAFIKGSIILILLIECFLVFIWFVGFIKELEINLHSSSKVKASFCFIAINWWFLINWLENLLQKELENYLYPVLIILLFGASIYGIFSVVHYLQRYHSHKTS